MALMDFTDKMKTGMADIDSQHHILIGIINELYNVALGRADANALGDAMQDLSDYLDQHLAFEEDLFAKTAYPDAAKHKGEHDMLRKRFAAYRSQMTAGRDMVLALDLLHFLKQWLVNHIQVADKAAGAYLNGLGLR
jgi:hemerythrin-like metal-binding domain